MEMDKSEFLKSIEELFETDEGSLTGAEPIDQIPGWCSLIFVGFIAMIDEEYEVTLDPESLLNGQTVDGLFALIEQLKSNPNEAAA
jgi:acyl carrier protein